MLLAQNKLAWTQKEPQLHQPLSVCGLRLISLSSSLVQYRLSYRLGIWQRKAGSDGAAHRSTFPFCAPSGFPVVLLTSTALDGPHRGGCTRGRRGAQRYALVILGAALLNGPDIAVAPHAEAARHRQIQRFHRLRLEFAEHRLADGFELTIHLHLTHLQTETGQGQCIPRTDTALYLVQTLSSYGGTMANTC